MFEWLFKKKNAEVLADDKSINPSLKKSEINISDEVVSILEKWNNLNQTNISTEELLSMLQFDKTDYIDVKIMDYPIYDDVWKIPGYIGSFRFDISINKENSLNEYSKRFLNEIGENNNVRHIIHLCKDGFIVNMDYKIKTREFRNFKITYKIDKKDSDYDFKKTKEYSLIIFESKSVYSSITDSFVSKRYIDTDGYHVININERLFGNIFTKNIRFKLKNNVEFDYPCERELMEKIGVKSVTFPENIIAIIVKYFRKYNLEIEDIIVDGINNENNLLRSFYYRKENDGIKVALSKKEDKDSKQILKTIDVSVEQENNYYVRKFTIKTIAGKDMVLKVYYNNSVSFTDRDFEVIDYFMSYFPVGLIDKEPEWYHIDIYFRLLCQCCFDDNMSCIDRIYLEYYEFNKLVETREWKRYNLEHEDVEDKNPVLQRK